MPAIVIGGLDLSARATGMVSCPLDWDGDWKRVDSFVVGRELERSSSDEDRARRCRAIARDVVAFARTRCIEEFWIEGYAFSQNTSAHTLAEVGGVVRVYLLEAGIRMRTANVGTARKLMLGKLPRSGAKEAAFAALKAAGAPAWSPDEGDAFVACNLGLSTHDGAYCFAQSEPR